MATTVRRRARSVGDPPSHITDLPSIKEESFETVSGILPSHLVENGKALFERGAQSGYKKADDFVEGLKLIVNAAMIGSDEAVEEIESILVKTSEKRMAFLLDELPRDLLSTAKVLVRANDTEKQVMVVAREMFQTMAKGKKEIKSEDIDQAVMNLLSAEAAAVGTEELKSVTTIKGSVKRLLKISVKPNSLGEDVVTEQEFCLVACQYGRGELVLPLDSEDYQMSKEQYEEFKNANWIKKSVDYPKQTAQYVGQYTLKAVEKNGIRWVWSYIPMKQLQLLGLLYVLPLLSVRVILSLLATAVFFCSFLSMIISTLQIVSNWRRINWFMEYSTIFRYFSKEGQTINTKVPEMKLLRNTSTPYISFTISTVLTIFTISLTYQVIMVYELLLMVSSIMTLFVFMRFRCWESPIIIGSITIRVLSWSLVLLILIDKWLPIPDLLFMYGERLFTVSVFSDSISVEVNFISLVQIPLQLGLIVYLGLRSSKKKQFLAVIGSYVLFMCWWIFSKQLFTHCSLLRLLLFIPCVFGVFFLAPLTPVALLLAPIASYIYFGLSIQFLVSIGSVVILGSGSLLILVNYKRLKEMRLLNIRLEYLFLIQLVVCVPVMYIGAWYYSSIYSPAQSRLPVVTMDQYTKYCTSIVNDTIVDYSSHGNSILTQLNCYHLQDRVLMGEARVNTVTITMVRNSYGEMVDKFPKAVAMAITCFIGDKTPECGPTGSNSPTCLFKGCNFDSLNQYTVTISATTTIGVPIPIHILTNISHRRLVSSDLMKLKQSMIFLFNGTIVSGAGSLTGPVVLDMKRIVFMSAEDGTIQYTHDSAMDKLNRFDINSPEVFIEIYHSLKKTMSFILETVVGYTLPLQ